MSTPLAASTGVTSVGGTGSSRATGSAKSTPALQATVELPATTSSFIAWTSTVCAAPGCCGAIRVSVAEGPGPEPGLIEAKSLYVAINSLLNSEKPVGSATVTDTESCAVSSTNVTFSPITPSPSDRAKVVVVP